MLCTICYTMTTLSIPCLPGMKVHCCSPTNLGIKAFNLFVIIFVIPLTTALQSAIGRKWDINSWWSYFWIKAIEVSFIFQGKEPFLKAFVTKWHTADPTTFQLAWKKKGGKPSGPGAFLLLFEGKPGVFLLDKPFGVSLPCQLLEVVGKKIKKHYPRGWSQLNITRHKISSPYHTALPVHSFKHHGHSSISVPFDFSFA